MKINLLAFVLLFGFIITGSSCSEDEADGGGNNPCSTAYATELQDEINALNAAAMAYGLNQTQANCIAYKAAAQAYLNALEPYGDCNLLTGQQRIDWEKAYQSAKDAVAAIPC